MDVAAGTAQVAVQWPGSSDRHGSSDAQTKPGWQELAQRLLPGEQLAEQMLVVMKATPNYWTHLATSLRRVGETIFEGVDAWTPGKASDSPPQKTDDQ